MLFKNETDISNDWLNYISSEAENLSKLDDSAIDRYMDGEILNPDIGLLLDDEAFVNALNVLEPDGSLSINGLSAMRSVEKINHRRKNFKKLKEKVRKVFCEVTANLEGDVDLKTIVSTVIVALIPIFAGGISAALLPIIIGIIAYFLKKGYENVCPA